MIIGNGLIADAFKGFENNKVIIFASGVSNSLENKKFEFQREETLLKKTLVNRGDRKIVYFSTCYFNDIKYRINYAKHKRNMENIIEKNSNYLILRLPLVIGKKGNKKNFFNYIVDSFKKNKQILLYKKLRRNLIDINDITKYTKLLLKYKKDQDLKLNLASKYSWTITTLVNEISKILNKETKIIINNQNMKNEKVNTDIIETLNGGNKKLSSHNYYKILFNKYLK